MRRRSGFLVLLVLALGWIAAPAALAQTLSVVDRLATDTAAETAIPNVRFAPGETVYLRLVLGADPGVNNIQCTVEAQRLGAPEDTELVTLQRVPGSATRYTGFITTQLRRPGTAALGGNGSLDVRGASTISASTTVGGAATVTALVATVSQVEAVEGPGNPNEATGRVTVLDVGERLFVRVVDDDRNTQPGVNDTLQVTIADPLAGGDSETFNLLESAADSGVFFGSVATRYAQVAGGTADDGVLNVAGTGIEIRYTDSVPVTNGPQTNAVTSAVLVRGVTVVPVGARFTAAATQGAAQLVKMAPGQTVFVEVVDPSSNLSDDTDTVTVTVAAQLRGTGTVQDRETFVLTETGDETGVFTGPVPTAFEPAFPVTGNGRLEVGGRHELRVESRSNETLTNPAVNNQNPLLQVNFDGRVRFVENAGRSLPGQVGSIAAGDMLFVELVDDDLNSNNSTDVFTVNVTSSTGDLVRVQLRKTSAGSPTFTIVESVSRFDDIPVPAISNGMRPGLRTEVRAVVADDGVLQVAEGGTIGISYTDGEVVNGTDGSARPSDFATVVTSVVSSRDVRIRALAPGDAVNVVAGAVGEVIAGQPVCVEVDDIGRDVSTSADQATVTVRVRGESGGAILDQETIRATETDASTGVFRGCVNTNLGPRVTGDGALTVEGNEIVELVYATVKPDGTAVDLVTTLSVRSAYRAVATASNQRDQSVRLRLPNGAQLLVPPNATFRPTQLAFEVFFGTPGSNGPVDETGNALPPPLNANIKLTFVSRRPLWYDVQPTGTAFRSPVEMALPIPPDLQVLNGPDATSGVRALTDTERTRQLKIAFFDGFDWVVVGGRFVGLGSGPDPAQQYITAPVNHLTVFALVLDTRALPVAGGPLLTSLSLNNTTFTPNGDGANDTTTVNFALSEDSLVTIRIFDAAGEVIRTLVRDLGVTAGFASQQWDGSYLFAARKAPAGLYVVEVKAINTAGTRSARETILVGVLK